MTENLQDAVLDHPVHLVGEEDDGAACFTTPEYERQSRTDAAAGMAAERQAIREEVRQVALGCLTCGQVHQSRPVTAVNGEIAYQHHTTAAEDGHAYRPRYRGMEPEDLGAIILHGTAPQVTP